MSDVDKDFEDALEALARVEGKSVEDLKREMLRERVMGGRRPDPAPAPAPAPLARVGTGDASGASLARMRSDAIAAHHAQPFPGSPVVRYERDRDESPAEAAERWYEEESNLADGVHGIGGQTAGGIFGDGPIATSLYDPSAMGRADARVGSMANIKLLGLVERLEQRLAAAEQRHQIGPGQERGQLPGGGTRRLGRGKR